MRGLSVCCGLLRRQFPLFILLQGMRPWTSRGKFYVANTPWTKYQGSTEWAARYRGVASDFDDQYSTKSKVCEFFVFLHPTNILLKDHSSITQSIQVSFGCYHFSTCLKPQLSQLRGDCLAYAYVFPGLLVVTKLRDLSHCSTLRLFKELVTVMSIHDLLLLRFY